MRHYFYLVFAVIALSVHSVRGEQILFEVEFETYFDNKEYCENEYDGTALDGGSNTDFAVRLAPKLGWRWAEESTLYFGADLIQDFGEYSDPFFSISEPIIYYEFKNESVKAAAGIFPRALTHIASYSTAFFSEDYLFYDALMSGVYGAYNRGESFVEFGIDWEGHYSTLEREKFRLLSAGRYYFDRFYLGYNYSLMHYAKQQGLEASGVVDFTLINPCVGLRLGGDFDFDLSLGLLQSMQRDRSYGDGWLSPRMGELSLRLSRWGAYIDERLYLGQNLYPLFYGVSLEDGTELEYGTELYPGDGFFRTEEGIYNRAAIGYARAFYDGKLNVRAELVTHYDGVGVGMQQIVDISVRLGTTLYRSKNKQK